MAKLEDIWAYDFIRGLNKLRMENPNMPLASRGSAAMAALSFSDRVYRNLRS